MNEGACITTQAIEDPESWCTWNSMISMSHQGLRTSLTQHQALEAEWIVQKLKEEYACPISYAPDFEICKIAAAPGRVPQIFHLLVVVVVGGVQLFILIISQVSKFYPCTTWCAYYCIILWLWAFDHMVEFPWNACVSVLMWKNIEFVQLTRNAIAKFSRDYSYLNWDQLVYVTYRKGLARTEGLKLNVNLDVLIEVWVPMRFVGFLFFFLLMEVESKGKEEKRRIADGTMQNNLAWLYLMLRAYSSHTYQKWWCECNWRYMYHICTHHQKIVLCTKSCRIWWCRLTEWSSHECIQGIVIYQ